MAVILQVGVAFAQAPSISFTTPQVLLRNSAVTINPSNSGGSIPSGSGFYKRVSNLVTSGIDRPAGLCLDAAGNVYLADTYNHVIRKITPAGVSTIIAGVSGSVGVTEGAATSAKFRYPTDVALNADETILYICDKENHAIRQLVLATSQVSTIAGSLNTAGDVTGSGTTARFRTPQGIVIAGGALFVTDLGNEKIKKIELSGSYTVSLMAGTGATGGSNNASGSSATFSGPQGITADASHLYITEFVGNRIRKISLTSPFGVTTLAGSGTAGAVNATGTSASFRDPKGITIDGGGDLYVADQGNHLIRKITAGGVVTTLAGTGTSAIATGDSTSASFNGPSDIFINAGGVMHVADQTGSAVRKIEMNGYQRSGLPAGLSLNGATGVISGTPTTITAATDYYVNGFNYYGSSQATINISVVDPPTVSTTVPSAITSSTATVGGNVSSDGGAAVTERGVVWSTAPDPTIALSTKVTAGSGTGSFSCSLTGLTFNTTYYVRAYATNANGTGYGTAVTFTTLQIAPSISYSSATLTLASGTAMTPATLTNVGGAPDKIQVTTLAGSSSSGNADGTGSAAKFSNPQSVAVDGTGNVYVADQSNHRIRKITSGGVVTTLAGSTHGYADGTGSAAKFNFPTGIAVDGSGNVYVADWSNHRIRKITSGGVVTTLAGSGTPTFADGTGSAASFSAPEGVAVDGSGNVYVADVMNNRIRKITSAGVVSTFAGNYLGNADGTGSAASFFFPTGVAVDGSGNVYVADQSNNRIRKITSAGVVSTFAGSAQGYADGTGSAASFSYPTGIAVDGSGNVYVADRNNERIRKITSAGVVTTLAGSGVRTFTDGTGSAAGFRTPSGMAVDGSGNVYVADQSNNRIRLISSYRIDPALPAGLFFDARTGTISGTPTAPQAEKLYTVYAQNSAGNTTATITVSVASPPTVTSGYATAILSTTVTLNATVNANGATTTALGIKYATVQADVDAGNGTVASISPTSVSGNTVTGFSANITGLSPSTTYYFRVYATNVAGSSNGSTLSFTTAPLPPSISYAPSSVTLSLNTAMTPLTPVNTGGAPEPMQVSTLAGGTTLTGFADGTGAAAKFSKPSGVAVDGSGNVYVADQDNHRIRKVTSSGVVTTLAGSGTTGSADGTGSAASFNKPQGITMDASGNLYVADAENSTIRMVTQAGVVTTLAGSGTKTFADGTGSAASFNNPVGIAVDGSGNVYVADHINHRIRKVTSSGVVTTMAGSGTSGFADGTGTAASFKNPWGVAVDGSGNVYVGDASNYRIRKITASGVVSTLAGNAEAGFADGYGPGVKFISPRGVAVDGSGNVYVGDASNYRVRKITSAGVVSTLAGSQRSFADGTGSAAGFGLLSGVSVDGSGNVYVSDAAYNAIRKITIYSISPSLPPGLSFNTATGAITGTPTSLSPATTYTVTSSNLGGTSTTTITLAVSGPILTTDVTAIGESTATGGGTVGASYTNIVARGVVWNTSPSPIVALSTKTTDGSTSGTFTSSLSGLTPNTTYYVRSYVTHGSTPTTEYGSETSFKTNSLGTFANITKSFGDAKFSLTAPTAVSTGAFSYASSNTGVATISGSEVTISGAGTTTITATQAATATYAQATKALTLTVNKGTPTLTLSVPTTTALNQVTGANTITVAGTSSDGQAVTMSIVSGGATGTLTATATPGSYTLSNVSSSGSITFEGSVAGNSNADPATKQATMDVTLANQAITFSPTTPLTYSTGLTATLSATGGGSGNAVTFTVVSGPGNITGGTTLNITEPGTIVVKASQAGSGTHNAAPEVTRSIVVNPGAPVVSSFTPASATTGDMVTITGQYFDNISSVTFGGTAATSFTRVSSTSITAVVGTGHTGSVAVTTTGGTHSKTGFRYKVTWTGATTAFGTASNWSNSRSPQTDDDILFSPTAASDLELDGHKTVGHVDFNGSGRAIRLGANNLTVKGNLTMPGSISGTGKVIMAGTAAQTITGGGSIPDLEINSSGGVTISSSGGEVNVTGRLRLTGGTITTNGKLRLSSTSSGTARVGQVTGTITGNVIAERYVKQNQNSGGTGRAWRLVSVPVSGTGTLRDFFMNGRAGQDLTLTASRDGETENSGTPIVGHTYATASAATTAGFDWIGVADQYSSLRSYVPNAAGGSFASENVPTLSTTYASAAQGYMVFTRGDRKLEFPSTNSSSATTFRSTGTLKTGNQTVTVQPAATHKFTLVGNPYMSVLDLSALHASNSTVIEPSFWIWDANIAGSNYQGGYVNVYKSGTQWVTNTGSYINPERIESGMAFFVEPLTTLSSSGTLTISETHKSSDDAAGLSPMSTDNPDDHGRMYVRLERADEKGQRQIIDGVMADFHKDFKDVLGDPSDRTKLQNGISRGALWFSRDNKVLSGQGLPWPTSARKTVPIYMSGIGDQTLVVRIEPRGMENRYVQAWLKDNVLKREVEINMNAPTDYDFIGTGSAAWDSTRFELVFIEAGRPSTGVTLEPDGAAEQPSVKLYPNPSKSADVKLSLRAMVPGTYSVQILDMTGRLVASTSLQHRSVNGEYRILEGRLLSPGTYIIKLSDQNKQPKETLRLVVE